MAELDAKAKLLLNAIQAGVPLMARPYEALAQKAGLSEDETLARIRQLKERGVLRQVSAIFDTRALGYDSCLAACQVAPERVDAAAEILNGHPGISHNYARNHAFNLWFTLAVPPGSNLQAHADVLRRECGAASIRLLPALRVFKIGVKLDMVEDDVQRGDAEAQRSKIQDAGYRMHEAGCGTPLTERDIRFVRALQKDMAVVPEPFAAVAEEAGTTVAELFAWCEEALRLGRLRRVAGVLHHRAAGFGGNGMGVWRVAAERVEEAGAFFAAQTIVTHCYERPSYPDWPYNVFTMVHARTVAACEDLVAGLARASGIQEHSVLFSHKEYKKTRLRYFTGEIEAWERQHGL